VTKHSVLVQALASTPVDLSVTLNGFSEQAAKMRPSPESWSISDVLGHLASVEKLYLARFKRVLSEDRPLLPEIVPDESAHRSSDPLPVLLASFEEARGETVALLQTATGGDWGRPAVHETRGETDFRRLAELLLEHDVEHLNQVAAIWEELQMGQ
jgi:uncharacterized damage-inducible protein DinB